MSKASYGNSDVAEEKYSDNVNFESKAEGKSLSRDDGGSGSKGGGDESKSDEAQDNEDTELIERVQEYFFCNEDLATTFERFVKSKAHVVDLDTDENKLEYTTAFNEYKDLFESTIEGHMGTELNIKANDLYLALQRKTTKDENSNEAIFGQILIAVCDFDVFMQMMRDAAREHRSKSAAEADEKSPENRRGGSSSK